jgi:hypothetical protein
MRTASSYHRTNLNLYIAQYVLIYAGPPIYSAAEYDVLGRLMGYLPMHAPLHPRRVVYFCVYLGAAVEGLTAAGAAIMATASGPTKNDRRKRGALLLSIALVLQAVVETLFMSLILVVHRRYARACRQRNEKGGTARPRRNVHNLCLMLYGTSTLALVRCVFRAVESFGTADIYQGDCRGVCRVVLFHEWFLYVFEAAPMVLYTFWINVMHPGRFLPGNLNQYLDLDGTTERVGPGWTDTRSQWETFVDPFDTRATLRGHPNHVQFWLKPEDWPVARL